MSYSDPARAPSDGQVLEEGVGVVTSDSLAAESYNAGGGFQGVPQSVPSKSTTANTTDTAGASILPPAADRSSRVDAEGTDSSYSGPVDTSGIDKAGGASAPYNTTKGYVDSESVGTAPSYVDAVQKANSEALPKGENLKEGGFDGDAPNASFNTDIGNKNDPGKAAEDSFQRSNARGGAGIGISGDSDQREDLGGYEQLNREEQA